MKVLQHLHYRNYNTDLHSVLVSQEEGVATFPLWNLSGKMTGYQQYRPLGEKKVFNNPQTGKYYTHRNKDEVAVWGMESWNMSNTLFVTEGVFDASALTACGFSALALLSNDQNQQLKSMLKFFRSFRPVVAVCDGDAAGRKLAKAGHIAYYMDEGYDLGDMTLEYVKYLGNRYNV